MNKLLLGMLLMLGSDCQPRNIQVKNNFPLPVTVSWILIDNSGDLTASTEIILMPREKKEAELPEQTNISSILVTTSMNIRQAGYHAFYNPASGESKFSIECEGSGICILAND